MSITKNEKKMILTIEELKSKVTLIVDSESKEITIKGNINFSGLEYVGEKIQKILSEIGLNYDNHQDLDTNL